MVARFFCSLGSSCVSLLSLIFGLLFRFLLLDSHVLDGTAFDHHVAEYHSIDDMATSRPDSTVVGPVSFTASQPLAKERKGG